MIVSNKSLISFAFLIMYRKFVFLPYYCCQWYARYKHIVCL